MPLLAWGITGKRGTISATQEFFGPPTLILSNFAAPQAKRMHIISFDNAMKGAIDCLVKSKVAISTYITYHF